ncbi:hypothetical protein BKA69DRAFT_12734 [Paraphysoderma sedebokerense]|nr:hypothetical protein BKA69DRAFT_12734 [Paraphysoderma sedebokerense]
MKCIVSQPLSYFIPTLQQQSTAVTQSETLTRLQSFIEAKLKLYGDLLKTNGSRWRELGFPMMEDLFVNLRSHLLNAVGVFVETVVERLESVTTHLGRDMLDDGMVVDSGHGAGRIDENISKEMELTIASLRLLLSSLSLCGGIPTVAQMEHPHSIPTPISSSEPTIITPSTLVLCKLPIKLVNFFCVFLNYQLDRVTPTKEKVTSAGSISPRLLYWIQSLAKALGYLKDIKDALGSFSAPGLSSSNARNPHDHLPLSASSSSSSSSEYLDHHHRITPSSISTSSSITGLFFDSLEDQLSTSIVETTLRICSHINKPTFTHPSTYTSSSSFAGRNSVLTSSDVGGSTTGGVGSAKLFQSMMLCVVDIKLIKRCLDWWQNGFGAPSQYAALGSTHTGTGNAVIKHLWHQACSRLNRLEQLVEGYDDS